MKPISAAVKPHHNAPDWRERPAVQTRNSESSDSRFESFADIAQVVHDRVRLGENYVTALDQGKLNLCVFVRDKTNAEIFRMWLRNTLPHYDEVGFSRDPEFSVAVASDSDQIAERLSQRTVLVRMKVQRVDDRKGRFLFWSVCHSRSWKITAPYGWLTGAPVTDWRQQRDYEAENFPNFGDNLVDPDIEIAFIADVQTPNSKVVGETSLTEWLRDNLHVAVIPTRAPFDVERKLIAETASPLNIAQRRCTGYPRRLAQWRRQAFAPNVCQRWYR